MVQFYSAPVAQHASAIDKRPHLQPLPPPAPVPEYVNYRARVRKWSYIQAADRTYTVPSRLIGKEVQIRLYAEHLEVGFA